MELTVGRYRLNVVVARPGLVADIAVGQLTGSSSFKRLLALKDSSTALPGVGKRILIHDAQRAPILSGPDAGGEVWTVDFTLQENPVPVAAIVTGLAILVGVTLIYMTFKSIERISENAPLAIPTLGIGLILVIGLIVAAPTLWKKLFSS